jgi:anti-sigma factor RsiW
MHDEMRTLLNAYLDGELHGRSLRDLETHLLFCQACRNELEELRLVSNLLQADPAPEFTSTERFVSQLSLSLPRRSSHRRPATPGSLAWWLVPVGLIGAWFFVQTVFTLTNLVTAVDFTGLLGHSSTWMSALLGGGQESTWFSATAGLFGGQTAFQPVLSLLNNASVFSVNLLSGFVWQALIVLLYWAWLAFWWLRNNPRNLKAQNA